MLLRFSLAKKNSCFVFFNKILVKFKVFKLASQSMR